MRVSVYFCFVHLSLVADCMSGMCVACVVSGVWSVVYVFFCGGVYYVSAVCVWYVCLVCMSGMYVACVTCGMYGVCDHLVYVCSVPAWCM